MTVFGSCKSLLDIHMKFIKVLCKRYDFNMATRPEVSFQNAKKKETQSGTIIKFKEMLKANPEELGTSGSHWSAPMFSKYKESGCIQIKSDLKISPSGNSIPDDLWKGVEKEYRKRAKCVGRTDKIPDFLSNLKVEPKVAYFIDVILTALVSHHQELHLGFQETLNVEGLPTSRPDNPIYTKDNQILGCVEIKATNLVAQKALVQCRLQLLSLHTRANHSLFGIVTDAKTFILMTLDEDGIFHEEEDYGAEGSTQRAKRTCENWDNLKEILDAINDLLCYVYNEATQSVNVTGKCKPTLKKPTLKNEAEEPSQFKSTSKCSRARSSGTVRHGEEGNVLEAQQGMQGLTINEQEPTSKGSSTPL